MVAILLGIKSAVKIFELPKSFLNVLSLDVLVNAQEHVKDAVAYPLIKTS